MKEQQMRKWMKSTMGCVLLVSMSKGAALLERRSSTNFQQLEPPISGPLPSFTCVHQAACCNASGIGALG